MSATQTFPDPESFAAHLHQLRAQRRTSVHALRATPLPRQRLSRAHRAGVLHKSGGRCHICGGLIEGQDWDTDHVLAHSTGGTHDLNNYLAAHSLCNNYRWFYGTEEFQWILKLGVWLRTHIEKKTPIGRLAAAAFTAHERRRVRRRKTATET